MKKSGFLLIGVLMLSISGVATTLGQETVVFDLRKVVIGKDQGREVMSYDHSLTSFELSSDIVVQPGQKINWEIWVHIDSLTSNGLAMVCVDLVQDSGNPYMFHFPQPVGCPSGMTNFCRPAGITNPDESATGSGYTGTQGVGTLLQIGGAQNTFGSPLMNGVGESATVVPGIGTGQEVLLARGTFTAPEIGGRYKYRIENGRANVLDQVGTPPDFSTVNQANIEYETDEIYFFVQAH